MLVRSWLLMARVALVGVVAALVVVSDGAAAPKVVTVAIAATGPSPSTVRIGPDGEVLFVNRDSLAHTVVLRQNLHARWTCSLGPSGGPGSNQCTYGAGFVSSHTYTVDGQFPGKVLVVGLARSVSLTARTHTIALGSQLRLHGQITFDISDVMPNCDETFSLAILTRHDRSQPFKRIANFPVRPSNKDKLATNSRCTDVWQRKVRPGVATTYIARVTEVARLWRAATSRPFTVLIRP
jgi:plastocyanin